MPRIKKATDAGGTVFYPTTISKAVWDIDRNQRLNVTLDALERALLYKDVYIGGAIVSSTIVSNTYHHDSILRARPISVTTTSEYIWAVIPTSYTNPAILMGGLEVPIAWDSAITIEGKAYNIWKSINLYTGTFSLSLV